MRKEGINRDADLCTEFFNMFLNKSYCQTRRVESMLTMMPMPV